MMNAWARPCCLTLYYQASQPLRWWNRPLRRGPRRVPIAVLVVSPHCRRPRQRLDHFPRACSPGRSPGCDKHFELISLEEAQRRIRRGGNCRPAVSITFDDGYAENCRRAIPLLVKERIPCTYFVTVRNVLEGEPFAHDLAGGNRLPPNTLEQLQAMAAAGIEIGAHGYTHANLGPMADPQALRSRVVAGGRGVAPALGRPVRYFAFPFGLHANLNARRLCPGPPRPAMKPSARATAASTSPATTPFTCNGLLSGDDMIHLKNWTTVDPRKLKMPRFAYDLAIPAP